MSTVGGLSSSTSSSASSLRGYGGLASGLDRDTLIEQMTAGTQTKIDKKNQEKTKLQWEQELIQSITDQIYDFSQKYTSYTSSENLLGTAIFSRSDITVNGENSKYISVSGSTQTSELLTVVGVKQMAQNASATSLNNASDRTLKMGSVYSDLSKETDVNVVGGEKIYIKYGNTSYTVTLGRGEGYSYETAEDIANSINKALAEVSIGDEEDATLAKALNVTFDGNKLVFENKDEAGNNIEITGGSGDILVNLGFLNKGENITQIDDSRKIIEANHSLTAVNDENAIQKVSIAEQLAGQSISFVYNGTVKWIEMPSADDLKNEKLDYVREYLQKELDKAFGKGRIAVNLSPETEGKQTLSFSTTLPGTGEVDDSSVLSISAATGHLMGDESLFGVSEGESNRLNLTASIKDSGLANLSKLEGNSYSLTVNEVTLSFDEESSIQDIINEVNNNAEIGVKISYQSNTDKFVLTSTQDGASGSIALGGNLAKALFGEDKSGALKIKTTEGRDAVIAVQYAGTNEITEITRGNNTITVDGLNITVNNTFGYNDDGSRITDTEPVTFKAKVDTDKAVETIKEMVEEYNKILQKINDEVSTKPNRNYEPLTSSQKEEMNDKEIELWEEQAKKGLLFNDTDVRGLAEGLRFVIPDEIRSQLEVIGISVTTDYADNGKLVLDESKLRAALESNPENVRQLFSASAGKDEEGNTTKGGLMTNMKTILDRYASMTGATKGVLVERAGSEHSLTSVLNNSIQDQLDEIDDQLDRLSEQLATEQDRYISQFTSLETLISQMNSQSSWLSSMMG